MHSHKNTLQKLTLFLFLLALQFLLIFTAEDRSNLNYYTPYLLLITSLFTVYCYIYTQSKQGAPAHIYTFIKRRYKFLFFFIGMATILVSYEEMRKLFANYPDAAKLSDVMPQLDAQYNRFAQGIFPYSPVMSVPWHPYPVYMPLHWLPIGISRILHIDSRWAGFIILALATGLYGYIVLKYDAKTGLKIIALLLPSSVLWVYILWGGVDIPAVLETVISAYYLVLAVGLMAKNLTITTIGIILCLLSRYTMVFWLPLFFILLWQNASWRKNLVVWLSIIAAILCIYVLPFLLKDPTIFSKGLAYHNGCAYNCWNNFMNSRDNSSYYSGLFFAPRLYDVFTGTTEHKVFLARVVQGGTMLFLLLAGLCIYTRVKNNINFYHFSLAALYIFLLVFMLFAPFVFRYYYMPVLMLSSVVCAQAIISKR
jgi:hypothetical protein